MNKRDELKAYIDIYDPNVIGITEVKPKNARYVISLKSGTACLIM